MPTIPSWKAIRVTGGSLEDIASSQDRRSGRRARHGAARQRRRRAFAPDRKKCVFIYNTNDNRISGTTGSKGRGIGCISPLVPRATRSPGMPLSATAIRRRRRDPRPTGRRTGRGNYWSDNRHSISMATGSPTHAYRPNDLVDRVLWTAPAAKVLINSPAVQVLRWAQAQFPALYPGGVVDTHPLIAPPPKPSSSRSLR